MQKTRQQNAQVRARRPELAGDGWHRLKDHTHKCQGKTLWPLYKCSVDAMSSSCVLGCIEYMRCRLLLPMIAMYRTFVQPLSNHFGVLLCRLQYRTGHLHVKNWQKWFHCLPEGTLFTSFRILRSIRNCTDTLRDRLMTSCRFVPNLVRYICAKIYLNVKSFGKVIAKTQWCNFWDRV